MREYSIMSNCLVVINDDRTETRIYFNENTGKSYYRGKIGSIFNEEHTGIFLGVDGRGTGYFVHNHYLPGKASIETDVAFAKGQQIKVDYEKCTNSPLEVVEIALKYVIKKKPYNVFFSNCQHLTGASCNSRPHSPDLQKIVVILASFLFLCFVCIRWLIPK
jgi:hypothetical protein